MKKKEFVIIVCVFTLLRLLTACAIGLMPQDAYYTYYASHLSLSYFDHPPMVAYMIWVFTFIFGKTALSLHLGDFLVTSGTIYILCLLLRRILPSDKLKIAIVLLVTAPFIGILSVNSTPDVPLLFFWALSLLLLQAAVTTNKLYFWLMTGLACGLAFDSKYTAFFLPIGVFGFLISSSEYRKIIISWNFLTFILVFLLTISPVVIWNIQHDFISLKYQSSERATDIAKFQIKPQLFLGFVGSQLFLGLPALFIGLFAGGYRYIIHFFTKKGTQSFDTTFAVWFSFPIVIVFTIVSLVYWVKINWIMPAYLTGIIFSALYLKNLKLIRWQTYFSGILYLLAFVELCWMPIPVNSDDTWWGWKQLSAQVRSLQEKYPRHFVFSDDLYKTTAALNFYLPNHVYAGNVIDDFAYQFMLDDSNLQTLKGKNAIFVISDRSRRSNMNKGKIENILSIYFSDIQPLDSIILKNSAGKVQRRFGVFECRNYVPPQKKASSNQ